MTELLTTKELTERLKVTNVTLWRWRKEGLPHTKIGGSIRYSEKEVEAWIKAQNK